MALLQMTEESAGAVLAIDMASPEVGVAVVTSSPPGREASVLFEWTLRAQRRADAAVLPAVGEALAALDAAPVSLRGVAVTVGPGTFTGLRVGLASALGVALSRGVPVYAVGSLDARALLVEDRPLLVLLDARKGRFYGQWYTAAGADGPAQDVALDALLRPTGSVVGEGGAVAEDALNSAGLTVHPRPGRSPVVELARAALSGRYAASDPAEVGLRYVRPPDAKRPTHVLSPGASRS